jgi:hypothetical protein
MNAENISDKDNMSSDTGNASDEINGTNAREDSVAQDGRAAVSTETFRPRPERRRLVRFWGYLFVLAFLLCVLVAVRLPTAPSGAFLAFTSCLGLLALLCAYQLANLRTAFTKVGPDGIRIRRDLRSHELAWNDVANITARKRISRSPAYQRTLYSVEVTTTTGQRIGLAAPAANTSGELWMPDDEFREQYHRIMVHWKTATGDPVPDRADEFDIFDE